jgi:phosphoribosylanthranilate isomerase
MKKTFVKICGITNREDAATAIQSGADAVGFVFYPKSPRFISIETAQAICRSIPSNIMKIGVVVNIENSDNVLFETLDFLDYFQIYGEIDKSVIERLGHKIIKPFSVSDPFSEECLHMYQRCSLFLFDTAVNGYYGGTGKTFNWGIFNRIPRTKPIILAGGLNENNVIEAIRHVKPFMVDVSSSVEIIPGKKDAQKIKRFIAACRQADAIDAL